MTAPTLLVVKDPTTPPGAEQQYLFYTEQTNAQGQIVSTIVWRGTVSQLNAQVTNAQTQITAAQAKLALVAALPT